MLGRVVTSLSKVREMPLSSKQMGNRTNKITNVEGRVVFDVMQVSEFYPVIVLVFVSFSITLLFSSNVLAFGTTYKIQNFI